MPHEPAQRFAPMVNLQQYYVEQFLHEALAGQPGRRICAGRTAWWRCGRAPTACEVEVEGPRAAAALRRRLAGGLRRRPQHVREQLGLALEGTQYEGRYVIVDIVQKTQRPIERRPGSTRRPTPAPPLLMHRQPDDVWRIDYQLRDDEDAEAALEPDSIVPRIQSHLDMIGERDALAAGCESPSTTPSA